MSALTCAECGSPARETFINLNFGKSGCQRIPNGLRCTNEDCLERQRAQDRADQRARDEAAIQKAIAAGVIEP